MQFFNTVLVGFLPPTPHSYPCRWILIVGVERQQVQEEMINWVVLCSSEHDSSIHKTNLCEFCEYQSAESVSSLDSSDWGKLLEKQTLLAWQFF